MKVFWTESALAHLDSIYDHIQKDSPHYARQVVDRLTRRSIQIGQFPHSGRQVPELDMAAIREVIESPYRLIFLIGDESIEILAVLHAAMSFPPDL
ncbi:MAG: type II toxin-antitoxin system RelE/ParE family toxin [Bradymonadaceae bacterium]